MSDLGRIQIDGLWLVPAKDYDDLAAELAQCRDANKMAQQHYWEMVDRIAALEARLAEAERLLKEARDDVTQCLNVEVAKGHDNTLVIEFYRKQLREIDAFLRPADSAPEEKHE